MKILGEHDDRTKQQLQRCLDAEEGSIGVLCADGHLGYSMPIGGVIGYRQFVSPSGVGYNIACGNLAVQTNVMSKDVSTEEMERIANEVQARVSFGMGRKNNEPVADDPVFEAIRQSPVKQQRNLIQLAQQQLGTVGGGNHYVDILTDEAGVLWVACHFGSRGFGHKTATGFMNIGLGRAFDEGKGEGEMDAPPILIDFRSPAGQDYIEAMKIASQYAYAGRTAVVKKVLDILGAEEEFIVHNHHNFAWQEAHEQGTFWVVRKGATPAFPGQWGFIGGSMGDISVIVRGVDSPASVDNLYSTVHGAGRVMSRTQAAGKAKRIKAKWACGNHRVCPFTAPIRDFERGPQGASPRCPACSSKLIRQQGGWEPRTGGLVDFDLERVKLAGQGVILRGAGADEAPPVYRPLGTVLAAHQGTIEIAHTMFPRVVVMAGADEVDLYKD